MRKLFLCVWVLLFVGCNKYLKDKSLIEPPFGLVNTAPPYDTISIESGGLGLYLNGLDYGLRYSLRDDSIIFKPFYYEDRRFAWSILGSELKLKADSAELNYRIIECMGLHQKNSDLIGFWKGEILTYSNSVKDSIRTLLMPSFPLNLEVKADTIRFWSKVEDYNFEWNTSCVGSILYDKQNARRVFRFKFLTEDSLVLKNLKGPENRELVFQRI